MRVGYLRLCGCCVGTQAQQSLCFIVSQHLENASESPNAGQRGFSRVVRCRCGASCAALRSLLLRLRSAFNSMFAPSEEKSLSRLLRCSAR